MTANVKFSQLPNLTSITANTIIPVVAAGTNYTVTTANLQTYVNGGTGNISSGNITATGSISAVGNITGNYFLGNGSQLTGLGNITGTISATGNITGGNILTSGLVSATGNVSGNYLRATLDINAGGNVTATSHTGTTVSVTGNVTGGNIRTVGSITAGVFNPASISTSGNITGNYLLGNGSQLTGITSSYGNPNVATFLAALGSNAILSTGYISTTGNIACGDANIGNIKYYSLNTNNNAYFTGSNLTPDTREGIIANIVCNNNFTLNVPQNGGNTWVPGQSMTLVIHQDATGNRVMTPNSQYKFAGGVNTLSTAPNAIDTLDIFYDGSYYLCNLLKGYS